MSTPIVAFVGCAGETATVVQAMVTELTRRGYRVGTLRHEPQCNANPTGHEACLDGPMGCRHAVTVSAEKVASVRAVDREPLLDELAAGMPDVDLVLVEGYEHAEAPTIAVMAAAACTGVVERPAYCIAVVADTDLDLGPAQFSPDDVAGLADHIESQLLQGAGRRPQAHIPGGSAARRPGDDRQKLSFAEALAETLDRVSPLGSEEVDLFHASGRVAAQELVALVNCPSLDSSLKDGYAVQSADVTVASPEHPVRLRLVGRASAGDAWTGTVEAGMAVRILTGAPIPCGADAVLSEEFTSVEGNVVIATNDAEPGRNILCMGSDVAVGQRIVATGELLQPARVGLLAAAGHGRVRVFRRPRLALVATGDELVAPGNPLSEGKLYASNLVTLASWCARYGMAVTTAIARDNEEDIRRQLLTCLPDHDAILVSGGAWTSERDLVARLLDELGWERVYHRVRMGPGKAVGLGMWQGGPVFCLPGGPSSNHMAFLQLALPALHRLEGRARPGLPIHRVRLAQSIRAQKDWTQFVHGRLEWGHSGLVFHPLRIKSRIQEMAQMQAVVQVPEGVESLAAGTVVPAQLLTPDERWGE